jgi:hypothetical protein
MRANPVQKMSLVLVRTRTAPPLRAELRSPTTTFASAQMRVLVHIIPNRR